MRPILFASIVLLSIFFQSCGEDTTFDVAPVFLPYVDRFEEVAAANGQTFDFRESGLQIVFRDAVSKESGGQCNSNGLIEIERFFWEDLDDFEKEGLIFHELGHCKLGRGHRNDVLANGEWASRMRGDPIPSGANAVINYAGTRQEHYRNEMFNENIPAPDWATWTRDFNEFSNEDKLLLAEITDTSAFDVNVVGLADGDFEIELIYNTGTTEGFSGVQFLGEGNDDRIRVGFSREGVFAVDSGDRVWGLMFFKENYNKLLPGDNKVTIRRIGEFYWVFLNEEFVYWFDYIRPTRTTVTALNVGRLGVPEYKRVTVSRLP